MLKKNKNILIFLSIGIVLVISMFFVLNKSHEYHELPKVKIKEQNNLKQFALMLEQDNGEYKESTGEFPTEGYAFNQEKSGCTDINGKIIDGALNYDYETYTVLVDTSKTSYCYLYYDKEPNISYLRSKDTYSQLTKELVGGMYRYQGTDNVSNWICFGTNNQEECKNNIDKYMYRIIGINAKGELYLLKETFLTEGEVIGFAWNDEYKNSGSDANLCPDGVCPEWNEADLFLRINGNANGATSGDGDNDDAKDDDTDIFVDSNYYDYLKSGDKNSGGKASDWYNLIDIHSWYYGDIKESTRDILYNGDVLYNIETGVTDTNHYVKNIDGKVTSEVYKWTNTVSAKISLMYLHDYAYAYPGGKPGSYQNVASSWIHFQKDGYNTSPTHEWLSTRWGIYTLDDLRTNAHCTNDYGSLNVYYFLNDKIGVRPVFYLTNSIELAGSGTKESPFLIKI